jgi:hypothetical protein
MEETVIQRTPVEHVGGPIAHNPAGGSVSDSHGIGTVEHGQAQVSSLHGIIAEFETPEELIDAAEAAKNAGYRQMDGYTPFPIEGLSEALGFHDMRVPWITLAAGTVGCIGGFSFVAWCVTNAYVFNIGGRPLYSWPQWIVPTFEMTILSSALVGIGAMLVLNGLPRPYHSVFNAPGFERASTDRFFLCIESHDAQFDRVHTRDFLQSLHPLTVSEVED